MHAPAIDGIADDVDFGIYFLNAESYVVDEDIEMTSTSDAELDSSSAIALPTVALDTGLEDDRFESGSIIFAIENFNGNEFRCCCGCWAVVFVDGEIVMIGGDDKGDAVIDCVLFAAVSIIGLFDVNGTPDGLRGCIPEEIWNQTKTKRTKINRLSNDLSKKKKKKKKYAKLLIKGLNAKPAHHRIQK